MFPLHTQFVEVIVTPIHHKLQPPECEIFCVASSIIWNCSNKLIFEDQVLSSVGLWSRAATCTTEFMEVNKSRLGFGC